MRGGDGRAAPRLPGLCPESGVSDAGEGGLFGPRVLVIAVCFGEGVLSLGFLGSPLSELNFLSSVVWGTTVTLQWFKLLSLGLQTLPSQEKYVSSVLPIHPRPKKLSPP